MTFGTEAEALTLGTDPPSTSDVMTSWWMAREYAISYGHLPGRAIARAKRLIDAELDKNFGQKTVGLKGSEIDIRRCTKEDLDAIDERPRARKAGASQANRASSELLLRP
jgi:hypothetical protein